LTCGGSFSVVKPVLKPGSGAVVAEVADTADEKIYVKFTVTEDTTPPGVSHAPTIVLAVSQLAAPDSKDF